MANVTVRHITQDPAYADPLAGPGSDPWASRVSEASLTAPEFLPGPATARLEVVDLDPDGDGAQLLPPVPLGPGGYQLPDERKIFSSGFMRCSVFAIAQKTLNVLEAPDILGLGRRLRWPWGDGPVRLVVRAGQGENAWYDREAREIRFFSFGPDRVGLRTHTALIHDVVAHEVGHLVVDSLLPWLHDAMSPQSLAIHEALADLIALSTALRAERLEDTLARSSQVGDISHLPALSNLEWSSSTPRPNCPRYLRSLRNDLKMGQVDREDPHALSQVLTGALFEIIEEVEARLPPDSEGSPTQRQKRVRIIGKAFRMFVFRGLDYVPPGEIGFVDLVRALLAFDESSHVDAGSNAHNTLQQHLLAELVDRGVVVAGGEARWVVRPEEPPYLALAQQVAQLGREALIGEDDAVRALVDRHRGILGVPAGPFALLPRLETLKSRMLTSGSDGEVNFAPDTFVPETILRVTWEIEEESGLPPPWPTSRRIRLGTMLAVGWDGEEPYVRAHLPPRAPTEQEVAERSRFLRALEGRAQLRAGMGAVEVTSLPGEPLELSGVQRAMHIRPRFG